MNRSRRNWKKLAGAALLACLLAGCADTAGPGQEGEAEEPSAAGEAGREETEPLKAGTIARRPDTGTDFMSSWQASRGLSEILTPDDLENYEFRCADLREADFSDWGDRLLRASFDDQTKWPAVLPESFDMEKLAALGKDPGLGVRELHEQGVTGKGVGIAIIDQTLLVEHQEYADRLRLYQEYHTAKNDDASMHGPAVASIALGSTVGVAPEALLYYIADDVGTGTEESFVRDMRYYAEDVDRFIALNETLPEDEKIRIISMSVGYTRDTKGAAEMDAAIARARSAGIAVIALVSHDPLMEPFSGAGRTPYGDPNDPASYGPGQFWEPMLYTGEIAEPENTLLAPMDSRTTAAQTGPDGYAHYANGGGSWTRPYIAGLYALACQVKPDVTFEEFLEAAGESARPLTYTHEGVEYKIGRLIDPPAVIKTLQERAAAGEN